ncbi:MAG TPA: FkbM family methyltransferase [Gemmatimonadaceae bacterium]|jgi:FkbM family methyltransferase
MSPRWFFRNLVMSWRARGDVGNFLKRLVWIYSPKLPGNLKLSEYCIRFRYPEPVGTVRLVVRDNKGADNFIHSEVFEHEYYRLPLADHPRTILDLGSNIGLTAVYFGRLYPAAKIACVEPMPGNLRILEKNLQLNSISATVFAAAAHSHDGTLLMEVGERDYGHKVAGPQTASKRVLKVSSISIPTIMRELQWPQIDLLKMDIEGHESTLLMSDPQWLRQVQTLCIELHIGSGEIELRSLAATFGYGEPVCRSGLWFMSRVPKEAEARHMK